MSSIKLKAREPPKNVDEDAKQNETTINHNEQKFGITLKKTGFHTKSYEQIREEKDPINGTHTVPKISLKPVKRSVLTVNSQDDVNNSEKRRSNSPSIPLSKSLKSVIDKGVEGDQIRIDTIEKADSTEPLMNSSQNLVLPNGSVICQLYHANTQKIRYSDPPLELRSVENLSVINRSASTKVVSLLCESDETYIDFVDDKKRQSSEKLDEPYCDEKITDFEADDDESILPKVQDCIQDNYSCIQFGDDILVKAPETPVPEIKLNSSHSEWMFINGTTSCDVVIVNSNSQPVLHESPICQDTVTSDESDDTSDDENPILCQGFEINDCNNKPLGIKVYSLEEKSDNLIQQNIQPIITIDEHARPLSTQDFNQNIIPNFEDGKTDINIAQVEFKGSQIDDIFNKKREKIANRSSVPSESFPWNFDAKVSRRPQSMQIHGAGNTASPKRFSKVSSYTGSNRTSATFTEMMESKRSSFTDMLSSNRSSTYDRSTSAESGETLPRICYMDGRASWMSDDPTVSDSSSGKNSRIETKIGADRFSEHLEDFYMMSDNNCFGGVQGEKHIDIPKIEDNYLSFEIIENERKIESNHDQEAK